MNRLRSEINLVSYLKKMIIFQQNDFKEFEDLNYENHLNRIDEEFPFHIYFICKRPRIIVLPDSFRQTPKRFFLKIKIQFQFEFKDVELEFENIFDEEVDLKSKYPYSYLNFIGKETGKELVAKISSLIDNDTCLTEFDRSLIDYEILYIGQAFGQQGERTATTRLLNHSTLQKIYSTCISENPDSEIHLAALHFGKITMIDLGDPDDYSKEEMKVDENRFDTITQKKFPKKQEINYIEAALIKYFQPPVNEKMYKQFPTEKHSSYRDCFKLKLNSIVIEIGIEDFLRNKMFTNHVPISPRFNILYHFTNDAERKKLFSLDEEEE